MEVLGFGWWKYTSLWGNDALFLRVLNFNKILWQSSLLKRRVTISDFEENLLYSFLKTYFFRRVLGSQQNWGEGAEISHMPSAPHHMA